ncbi:MAG: DUF364 domain-containing protein [Candidatus Bathyarchaeia archaeon]
MGFLERAKEVFKEIVEERNLLEESVLISFRPLKPEEAIGNPGRDDFPIIAGKEMVIEASFRGKRAHVFTDSPSNYAGKLKEILEIDLYTNKNRAIFVGALNAVLKYLGIIERTIHCRDDEPFKCGSEIARSLKKKQDVKKVGLVGLNPAILEGLVTAFGKDSVWVTDLNVENIGKEKTGVAVWDGRTMTEKMIAEVDLVLITGTTFVNGTYDQIRELVARYKKNSVIYGVTASGICSLLKIESICPYGRS